MDTVAGALVLGGLIGAVVGALLTLAVRRHRARSSAAPAVGSHSEVTPAVPAPKPPANTELAFRLVEVMTPAAVVVGYGDDVLLANDAARSMGLVLDGRLVVRQLVDLARQVRRGGTDSRDVTLADDLPAGRHGSPRVVGAHAILLDRGGAVALLLQDVTESRRVELVRRDFVANVSHELKTPVGALTLLAEAVQDAADDPEAVRRFAGRMQHEGDRLGRLVRELIDLSRLQGGDPMPPMELVGVRRAVHEACDRTRLVADAKHIDLVAQGTPDLYVQAVEAQVVTALTNLLTNAVAYSPEGTKVAIGYRARGRFAEIAVSDEGTGIPHADLGRVFERFYRVDPARSSATGGTGLGLAIVKHIATNHGGSVRVWSEEGRGSTFTLRLPLAVRPENPAAIESTLGGTA